MIFKGFPVGEKGVELLFGENVISEIKGLGIPFVSVEKLHKNDKPTLFAQLLGTKIIIADDDMICKSMHWFDFSSSFTYMVMPWVPRRFNKTDKYIPGQRLTMGAHLASSDKYMADNVREYRRFYNIESGYDCFARVLRPRDCGDAQPINVAKGYMHFFLDVDMNVIGYSCGTSVVWNKDGMGLDTYRFLFENIFSGDRNILKAGNRERLLIGADIETIIVDSDGIVHEATEIVEDNLETMIGTDGFVKTLEFRPAPAKSYKELVENIDDILSNVNQILPRGYDIIGGGGAEYGHSISVHIHFSGTQADYGALTRPDELVNIFDHMIYSPIMNRCRNWKRANEKYGKFGDYRSKANPGNDGKFPHDGFEWRGLPNVCSTRELLTSCLAIAEGIVKTWSSGKEIEFTLGPNDSISIESYKSLVNFGEIQDEIAYFVQFVGNFENLAKSIMREWYGKVGPKIEGQEIRVYHGLVSKDHTPLIMYHDKMIADGCYVHATAGDSIRVSHNLRTGEELLGLLNKLSKFCVSDLGRTMKFVKWNNEFIVPILGGQGAKADNNCLYIGIPNDILRGLQRPNGSRNYVKMFIQSLIRNI